MPSAWLYRKPADVEKFGEKKAPYYVCWYQEGRQKKRKIGSKSLANEFKASIEADLVKREIMPERVSWESCRMAYSSHMEVRVKSGTRMQAEIALQHFERLTGKIAPHEIRTRHIDGFAAKRLREKGPSGRPIRPATVNKELRMLRAFLRQCFKWKYLRELPEFGFVKEQSKLPTFIDAETFGKLYSACGAATTPTEDPGAWWRAYLTFLFMTGWRALEPLSVRRADVNFERGVVVLLAENNKGGRDELVPLHPLVLEHIEALPKSEMLFPWPKGRRTLWDQFHLIQAAAGVSRAEGKPYGFHDLRRGFATLNADRMTADALQHIMRHRDYGTTKRYVNLARQLNPAVANLFVPVLPKQKR